VLSRIVLAPVAVWLAVERAPTALWMGQFAIAALSDLLDGKLARRRGTATAGLRQADSIADTIYPGRRAQPLVRPSRHHRCAALGNRRRDRPQVAALSAGLVAIRARRQLSCALREAVWRGAGGGSQFDDAGALLWIALVIGVVSELEGIAISLVLRE
jgi:hypothetical protein